MVRRDILIKAGVTSALMAGLAVAVTVSALSWAGESGDSQTVAAARTRIPSVMDGLNREQRVEKAKELDAQEAKRQNDIRREFVESGAKLSILNDVPMTGSLRVTSDLEQLASTSTAIVVGTVAATGDGR
jgi:hypothetical protein